MKRIKLYRLRVYTPLMPKRLRMRAHLPLRELEAHYRRACGPVLRTHYLIVWHLSLDKSTREVAEATGYSQEWIREVARRYNESGPEGLGDRRHRNPGGASRALLDPAQREELRRALEQPPSDGGLWSSRKVARWIEERTGRRGVRAQRGWEYLKRLGHTPQVPRPSHADVEEQEAFKKSCPSA
jgi:transposase